MARPPCTPINVAMDGSTRASSMATMPSSRQPRPPHPAGGQAGHAKLAQARDEVVRELLAGPVPVDDRLDLLLHELPDPAEHLASGRVEQQLERVEVAVGRVGHQSLLGSAAARNPST